MKNMAVAKKLIISFLIVAVLAMVVGVVGIIGMSELNQSFSEMYDMQTVPMPEMAKIVEMIQRQRACMREMIIGSALVLMDAEKEGLDLIEDAHDRILEYKAVQDQAQTAYRATILSPEALAIFDEAVHIYETRFMECVENIYEHALEGYDPAELYYEMGTYTADINKVVDNFDICLQMKIDTAYQADQDGEALFNTLLILIIIVLAVALGIAVFLAIYISGIISKPLNVLSGYLGDAGSKGVLEMSPEEARLIPIYAQYKDETGQTLKAAQAFFSHVIEISKALEQISKGDLTAHVSVLGDEDVLGNSLMRLEDNLNAMFGEINSATGQVATGSKQVADGAQSLAQGSTEQAASIEQLSASIGDVASSTKANAEIAAKTARLSTTIRENAEKGSRQMDEMITAVKDINEASLSISKIIKTIDDIAFQTNILALNAAVEAARAGQHGKGFAVVAEEVRNLASKSAEAAKDTGDMIQNSMNKAELGSQIAGETATSLKEIVSGISESSELISQIAQASEDQSTAISQINTGVDQVAQVVQQNSATAEQSAAASEQMSSQSTMLEDLIAQFKLKEQAGSFKNLPSSPAKKPAASIASESSVSDVADSAFDVSDGDFGKY